MAKILDLLDERDPFLKTPTPIFDFANPPCDPVELANDLFATMEVAGGIGLAAPQCGLPYRVFVLRSEPKLACFNPAVVFSSPELEEMEEGCLTFPGLGIKISRPRDIRARYTTHSGKTTTSKFTGLTARAFQHETDHLNGILFTDRAFKDSPLRMDAYLRKRKKFRKLIERGVITVRKPSDLAKVETGGMAFDMNDPRDVLAMNYIQMAKTQDQIEELINDGKNDAN